MFFFRTSGKKSQKKLPSKVRYLKIEKKDGTKFMLVIWLSIPLCTTLCLYLRPKAMSFWGSWVEKFHSSLALLYATASLLICNHFSRKVVLQTQIFFLFGDPVYTINPPFFRLEKSGCRLKGWMDPTIDRKVCCKSTCSEKRWVLIQKSNHPNMPSPNFYHRWHLHPRVTTTAAAT